MSKELKKAFTHMVLPLTMLIVILVMSIVGTKAWFYNNNKVTAKGMSVSAELEEITISDTITVTKTRGSIKNFTYKKDSNNGNYYIWNDGEYLLDENGERFPLRVADLLPGETVDLTISYSCPDTMIGKNIKVYLADLTSDYFSELENTSITHSVFGVFKASVKNGENGVMKDMGYMQEYKAGVSDKGLSEFVLVPCDPWEKVSNVQEQNFKKVTFRIGVDFTQFNSMQVPPNALSEKSFTIGALKVGLCND